MGKRICGLIVILGILCGLLAASPAAYAAAKSLTQKIADAQVTRDGDKLHIKWQYSGLEGEKVKINLYRNGQFVRTIAEHVSIGKNGSGSAVEGRDWQSTRMMTEDPEEGGDRYQIEIVSMADRNLRVMSGSFSWTGGARLR